jgi:6-phosphofructo-2-kinase/fructose-2,6-biphosphatase
MGTGSSKEADDGSEGTKHRLDDDDDHQAGGQLYVSLKMENLKLTTHLVPHVYGSVPLVGSWDSSKAVIFFIIPHFFISGSFFFFY